MPVKTIKEEFEGYMAKVLPNGCMPEQYEDMKKCFYAATFSAICSMRQIAAECATEDAGAAELEKLNHECLHFYSVVLFEIAKPKPNQN